MQYRPLYAASDEAWWRIVGNFFGYPSCCVEAFVRDNCDATKTRYPQAPWIGTGYVPCLACAEKALPDFQAFVDTKIAPHRKLKEAFPRDS
ncbi:hypothetical protein [Burkholderia pseudomallei]|uniref:hypothetical protein n=1 Tax=Burkholderia pseudomallei TaxID=28450 RepID=UPI000537F524|nr:hypothetical protein [Burkholderia pseudomallei]KGX39663.1 hypothetical protein Y043_2836 [Burkholderia pseudomallei MSHR2138]KGX47844.1 hypothetical protein Y600_5986 [Burkholderia pseudomallei MSHR3709]